jgi:hypothetical protein
VKLTSLTSLDLWARHEQRCVQVLAAALQRLELSDPNESEQELNRRLYFCILEAARAIEKDEGIELPVVVPEGLNPPLASDQERNEREFKRPDFYWAYHDHEGDEPARQFVVECKRITVASRSWVYTEQYVAAGVLRFIAVSHAYGKAAPTGAMVGYLQELDHASALAAINACLQQVPLPDLQPGQDGPPSGELNHALHRTFPESPFLLRHFWRPSGDSS